MSNSPSNIWVSGDLQARDVAEYADGLEPLWDVELNQLEPAQSQFHCHFVTDGHAIVYDELYGARVAVCGALREGKICFAVSNRIGRSGCWKGRPLPECALGYTHGAKEVDVQWPHGTANIMAIMPREIFARRLEQLTGLKLEKAFPSAGMYLRLAPASSARLKARLCFLLRGRRPNPAADLQEELSGAIIEACHDGLDGVWDGSPAAWFHFRRAMAHLAAHETPPRLADLALELGLTLRSVEAAFHYCSGMAPVAYLRRERLNRVHEDLIKHGPADATVTELATRRGFTELGRFAVEYRRLFGVSPSQTLHRRTRSITFLLPGLR